jgi:predicted nucleotidyltransferase
MEKQEIRERVRKAIETLPHRDRVRRVALFGSHLHKTARPQSDIDLLIDLTPPVGFFDFIRMQKHFERSLGTRVDLLTTEALSQHFRAEVLREAETLYEP